MIIAKHGGTALALILDVSHIINPPGPVLVTTHGKATKSLTHSQTYF